MPSDTVAGTVPAAGAVPGQVDTTPKGQTITIRTDLYTAEVDTAGGVISSVALNQHRDGHDDTKPYLALQRNAERTYVAQAGLLGEGLPNHRTVYEVLPGPRTGTRRRSRRIQAGGHHRHWPRSCRCWIFPSRQLRHRRRVRHHELRRGTVVALRRLPADPRHEAAGGAELGRPVGVRRPWRTEQGKYHKFNSAISTSSLQTRHASCPTRRRPTAAGSQWSSTTSSPCGRPPTNRNAARVLREEARQRAGCGWCDRTRRQHRSRLHPARRARAPSCRTAGPGGAGQDREGPGPGRRLRNLHGYRRPAVLAAQVAVRNHRQLGLGDRGDDDHDQERVLIP